MTSDPELHYDRGSIAFHWITALLVAGLWLVAETADWLPRGAARSAYWSTHAAVGFALVLIVLARIGWRVTRGRRLPDVASGLLDRLGKATHHLLYVLLLIVLILGVANAFNRGYHLYGVVTLPQIGDIGWKRTINRIHEWSAHGLLALAGVHALAALWHHYIRRDGVLRRMWA